MQTPIEANEAQLEQLYKKHISKPCFSLKYSYDSEDQVGFFSFLTATNKKVEGQMRGMEPMFVSVTGFGDIRYDIHYPKEITNTALYQRLKELSTKCYQNFWKGAQI